MEPQSTHFLLVNFELYYNRWDSILLMLSFMKRLANVTQQGADISTEHSLFS